MARIKYQLTALNPGNIVSGSLCVITKKYNGNSYPYDSSPTANNYIYNTVGRSASQPGSEGNSQYFLGAGICSYKTPYYYISVNSVTYTFDAAGKPISSNAANYTLYSAVILNRTIAVGTVIPTNTDATQNLSVSENGATRGSIPDSGSSTSPETSIAYDDDAKKVVAINQLNARDEFAAAALRGMLNHIDDPSTMSKNEMFYLCDTSYKWAENMMTAAANARAGYSAQGYNADPMNSLIDAVDKDSQLEFTIAGTGITVNNGQSASYPGNSTFNLALSSSYLTNFLSSWKTTNQILNWDSLTNSGAEKIDASHLPNGTLTWSDLTNAGNSEKINNAHLDISSSNNVANKIPITNSSGVMEVGTYMDFHDLRENNTNATDYNTRLQIGNPSLNNGKGNTVTLPNNSGTLALVENTVSTSTTWWGRPISNGKVEGNINNANNIFMSGNLHVVGPSKNAFSIGYSDYVTSSQTPSYKTLLGVHSLAHSDPALYIGYGLRYDKRLELHGRKIQFTIQKSTATDFDEDASTAMTILGRESAGKEGYVGIGISDPTSKLHVDGAVRIGNILLTSEEDNTLKISKFDGTAANVYATGGVSSIMQNASINSDKKFYFDSTHYLHVENGVLKYFNGSADKTVNLT